MPTFRVFSLFAALFVSSALLVAGCGGDDDQDWQSETIRIGSVFSTTGDGAAFGPQQVKGAELAVEEINAGDGGINGAKLELIQKDDAGDAAKSATLMSELIDQDEVMAVLGPTFSNSSAEAHPVANEAKTPVLAVSNTAPGIVGDCAYPCEYIFRDSLGEAKAIPANIETLVENEQPGAAAILYPVGDPFGKTSAETAAKAFEANDVTVTESRAVGADGINLTNDVGRDVIMVTASSGEALIRIVKELRGDGFKGRILGGNAANSLTAAEALGADGKGLQSATAWYAGNTSEENQEFITAYKAKYGDEPDQFAAQAYTGVMLLAEATDDAQLGFKRVAADREELKDSLEGVKEETPLGDFSFTTDHDVNQPIWIVGMNGKGSFDLVKEIPAS